MHRNIGLGSWIARRARMSPNRVALVADNRRWSYRHLDERITCLAHALRHRGVDCGDRVAFLGHNHPAALETLFACGLLGATAVPVHPGFDEQAIIELVEDATPRVLVFTPELAGVVARVRGRTQVAHYVCTGATHEPAERYEELIRDSTAEPIDRAIPLESPCLIAFSSGTSGRNKGVVLTHGNMLFNAVNVLSCLDYVRDDRILTSAPLYRMGGLGFTLAMFLKGGTCVLQERPDPVESLRLIERHRVSVLFDSPHTLAAIERAPEFATADLSSLRICATGGSYVDPQLLAAFSRRGLCLQQGYGLTEAAPLALIIDCDDVADNLGAAGRPPLFGAVRVVDDDLEDVAPGEIGELLYNGPNVMQGYWHRARETSAALLGDGWLRTGDAARIGVDGMVRIVGRIADALMLGGRLLHPARLEARIAAEVSVAACAVVQQAAEAAPIAFVVAGPGQRLDTTRIAMICREELPDGWSASVEWVDDLPRNSNGKILRRRMRAAS
jgi:fatty-acyl-CoA synthase